MKDFVSFIKNYSTRDFIYFFSEISIELYKKQQNKSEDELRCSITFPLNAILHGFIHRQVQVMLSAWDIQDMAYVSIVNANDYRKEIMTREKAGTVVNLYRGYENEHSNSEYIKDAKLPDIFKFMMGMTYEQFKYQNLAWTYQSFSRNYHILLGSSKISRDEIVDINEITEELFGLSADEFLTNVLYLLWLSSERPDPLGAEDDLYKHGAYSILTKENLEKMLDAMMQNVGNMPVIAPLRASAIEAISTMAVTKHPDLHIVEPLGYLDFAYLLANARGIITDSGNVAEEATFNNVPCATLNSYTEHIETVKQGTNVLVGEDADKLGKAVADMTNDAWKPANIPDRWDGRSAERIVQTLIGLLE